MIKKLVLLFLILVLSAGCAQATDYYVSPDGTGDGLTVETPGDPSTLDGALYPGDVMYFLNGTYENKGVIFLTHSGNATHPITLTAYEGNPLLNHSTISSGTYAININSNNYITISNLSFNGYNSHIVGPGSHITIQNCRSSNNGGGSAIFVSNINGTDNIIENCYFSNSGWNSIQVQGGASAAYPAERIIVRNNTITNNHVHAAIDLFKHVNNVTIENNTIIGCNIPGSNIYSHDDTSSQGYLSIKNNTIRDSNYEGMYLKCKNNNSIIDNNTFINISNKAIDLEILSNVTISNNKYYTVNYPFRIITCDNILLENEYIDPSCHPSGDFGWIYFLGGSSPLSIYNHTGYLDLSLNSVLNPVTYGYRNGRVFTVSAYGTPTINSTLYTASGSILDVKTSAGVSGGLNTLVLYNYSAKPAAETATITPRAPVGTEILNFTAESTNGNLVTFDAWNLIPSAQYTIKEDGSVKSTQLANETGHISWNNDVWSEHIYTVILSPPVAAFSASPLSGAATTYVTFTDESTLGPTSWLWNFGDGTTSTLQNPVHTYSTNGTFTVNLTVSNAAGSDSEVKTDYITITDVVYAPVANFSANVTSGALPLDVLFTDSSTNTPTSWLWNFGDGTTSTDQNPTHTYSTDGSYTVTLTASNAAGSNTYIKSSYIQAGTTTSFSLSYVMWWLRVHTPWWGLAYPLVGEA